MAETITITLPAVITIVNTSDKAIGFVPYRENFTTYLPAGDTIVLEATTAGQVLYYLAQETEGLSVSHAAKNA